MHRNAGIDLRREISRHPADFVREHEGGDAAKVKTFFFGKLLAIFVTIHPLLHGPKKKPRPRTGASVFDCVAPRLRKISFVLFINQESEPWRQDAASVTR